MKQKILTHCFVLLTLLHLASAQGTSRGYQIRLDTENWGNASPADLQAVLFSACDSIHQHFGGLKEKEAIYVLHNKSGPITLFNRNVRGEIIVQLNANHRHWCQYSYQIAHEFCHILCRFRKGSRKNLWFEESLCEMASMFALRTMADSWKTAPPYPNWKTYSSSIQDYVTDLEKMHSMPEGSSLADFYKLHSKKFTEDSVNRSLNGKVAIALLTAFETNPEHWPAVLYLNKGKGKEDIPFPEYLRNWLDHAPNKHHIFIHSLARNFGISL